MKSFVGAAVETRRRFQDAWAASHQPARSPTRLSGMGFCAERSGVTRNESASKTDGRRRVTTKLSPVERGGQRTAQVTHRQMQGGYPPRSPETEVSGNRGRSGLPTHDVIPTNAVVEETREELGEEGCH